MHWASNDGVALSVLAPSLPFLVDTGDDVNENSIIVMHYRGFRELFMGEARLLADGDDIHADVLKVGHHGSLYASTPVFIGAVHPRSATISVGRHNTLGHPATATLETLERTNAKVFRTDRCGAFSFDVGQAIARTMLPCQ